MSHITTRSPGTMCWISRLTNRPEFLKVEAIVASEGILMASVLAESDDNLVWKPSAGGAVDLMIRAEDLVWYHSEEVKVDDE